MGASRSAPAVVFPGQPRFAVLGHRLGVADASSPEGAFNSISAGIGTIDLDQDPNELVALQGVRLFAGYASWAPGQLDAELVDDAWIVADATEGDLLTDDPAQLWWTVMRRQQGDLRLLANYPEEPWTN